ncbi:MAG: ACT domain-containing protein [Clostridiales bacterium]|nr:ACT domain-containing protein [Clostridiales bacterium]
MIIKQISIFIENRPGRLAEITDIIAKNNINIRALSIADTTNFGILRIIVDNPELVEEKLRENNITASITSVLSVAIKDRPGGLAEVLKILSDNGIAIEYMYAFLAKKEDEAYVIMRIEKDDEAKRLLEANGYYGLN